jgi:L-fuconolactonase
MALVIDTHTHVVDPADARYPLQDAGLPTGGWWHHHPNSTESFLREMDAAGVAGAVLVQCKSAYTFDNSYALDGAKAHPDRFVSVSAVDMASPERVAELDRWATLGMHGTRLFNIPTPDPPWLDDPATRSAWERCAERNIRITVATLAVDLPRLATALSWIPPEVTVALDHCGFVSWAGGRPYSGAADLFALARFENLSCKISTHMLLDATDEGADPHDVIEHLAEVFGPQRLMWGSDYANSHDRPYPALVDFAREACSTLSPDEQAAFLGGNALRMWPELVNAELVNAELMNAATPSQGEDHQ